MSGARHGPGNTSETPPREDKPALRPPLLTVLMRGFRCRYPRCGYGRLFSGYLSVPRACEVCGLEYEPIRSDDVPAYICIVLVGHIVVPMVLWAERL